MYKGCSFMKKNKFILLLLGIIFIWFIFPLKANADIGPKPSIIINFNGLEGETYYVTLLSSTKTTGPYSALNDNTKSYAHYQEGDDDYEIFQAFAKYQDSDSYYFLQYLQNSSETQTFSWTYYPPAEFKILIYFPETYSFIKSDSIYKRYAFDSYFTAEVSGTSITAKTSYDYSNELISLVVRILLTILIEVAIGFLFGFRERPLIKFIIIVNAVTQIALNVALNIINYKSGAMAFVIFYILFEIIIFIIESTLYNRYFKKNSKKEFSKYKPTVYALIANSVSFALGLGLAYWIPGIF